MFVCLNDRPLTLPNFLDSKKPFKSSDKYGGGYKSPYVRPSGYEPNSYDDGSYGGPSPSSNPAVHGHGFTQPQRGISNGDDYSAGYSYDTRVPTNQNFDDYHDVPGPKSFVSVSGHSDDGEPGDVLNVNHGYAYDYSPDDRTPPHRQSSVSYGVRSPGRYESDDPLHPLRDYHSTGHDGEEDMYAKLRQEYRTEGSEMSSPYFTNGGGGEYHEPSPTSVQQSKRYGDGSSDKPQRKKAYWSMSYVRDV